MTEIFDKNRYNGQVGGCNVSVGRYNYGQKDETCYLCGDNETIKHIFKCNGSKDYHLTTEKHKELTKRRGPRDKRKSAEETAEAIRHYMKNRAQIKEIFENYE